MNYKYNFHNILTIRSEIDLSDIVFLYDLLKADETCRQYDLTIKLEKHEAFEIGSCQKIAHGLYYSKDDDRIISTLRVFGIMFSWEIRHLLGDKTELTLNSSYLLFLKYLIRFPISSVYQVNILIKMIMQIKFLQKNSTFVVGGAVAWNSRCLIFSGRPGSGKTTAVRNMMNKFRCKYISEDMIILGDKAAYSFRQPLRIRKYNLGPISLNKHIDPALQYDGRLLDTFEGKFDVYFLETSSSNSVKTITNYEGIRKLCSINNSVLPYFSERILSSMSYVHEEFSLQDMQNTQFNILSTFFSESHFRIISARHMDEFSELIQ